MVLGEAPDPIPGHGEVVLRALHVSLNRGDLNDAVSGRLPAEAVLGSDVAGVVVHESADRTGPVRGSRVVGLASGAFSELVAVAASSVAVVPEAADLAHAAALPVAGLAALRTIRASGSLLGRRVLVTGASGGVGSFAVQLAAAAGAHVIAYTRDPARADGLIDTGTDEVIHTLEDVHQAADVVLDTVGGPQLVAAWERLSRWGDPSQHRLVFG